MKQPNKKVLLVSYYWPPAGGAGVQRWLLTTKYLVRLGWEVHVYCPENPSYPLEDASLERQIAPEIRVVKREIWEPFGLAQRIFPKTTSYQKGEFQSNQKQNWLAKCMVFIRGNFFVPDARKFWVRPSVNFLSTYLQEQGIPTVITTGPPHSMHLIGRKLSRLHPNLKWFADFRDPWTTISYHSALRLTKWAQRKHQKLEAKVLRSATAVVATSYADREKFMQLGAKRCVTITNGFDSEIESIGATKNRAFRITYVGGLEWARNPAPLWVALSDWLDANAVAKSEVELHFYGSISDEVREDLRKFDLWQNTRMHGYVPHEEANEGMRKADLLWLSNFDREVSKGIIPGKLFEYMASVRPILSLGPADADVARILEKCAAGKHFTYQQGKDIEEFLQKHYALWKNKTVFSPNLDEVQHYHRHELTKKWDELLQK